jgi:hypothetical protein
MEQTDKIRRHFIFDWFFIYKDIVLVNGITAFQWQRETKVPGEIFRFNYHYNLHHNNTETNNTKIWFKFSQPHCYQSVPFYLVCIIYTYYISGLKVNVFETRLEYRAFETGQIENYNIGICCFSAMHTALMTGWLGIRIMYPSAATCQPAHRRFMKSRKVLFFAPILLK